MLGNFFEYFLETGSNEGRLAVLGATSGDTGSAAIAGLRNKKGIDCIILFPNGRVSNIQERQMTTITDDNIHCVAIDGTFDDCQDLVKASFNTTQFRDDVHLGAVNSINWCRVLAQTTYYFWSYFRVTDQDPNITEVHFSVPTGNFGDVLAGYYAKQMGLPIGKLIVATNENDILHRFFTKGTYHRYDIAETLSPSMDICVSSNFERYLYHLANNDASVLNSWMNEFESTGKLTVTDDYLRKAQLDFDSARVDTTETLQIIQEYFTKYNYVLCPHSAVGVAAIHQLRLIQPGTVCLATAHDGKFPDAVQRAIGTIPTPPPELAALYTLPTRRTELPNDLAAVQTFVKDCLLHNKNNRSTTKKNWWMSPLDTKLLIPVAAAVGIVAVTFKVLTNRRR
jgi:threonine synthase